MIYSYNGYLAGIKNIQSHIYHHVKMFMIFCYMNAQVIKQYVSMIPYWGKYMEK